MAIPMFTARHFKEICSLFYKCNGIVTAYEMAEFLHQFNPNFDRVRFLKECTHQKLENPNG